MRSYARKKMCGHTFFNLLRITVPAVIGVLFLGVLLSGILCVCYGTDTVLRCAGFDINPGLGVRILLPLIFFCCAAILLMFIFALVFYSRASIFFELDGEQTRPKGLMCISHAFRFAACQIRTSVFKLLWFLAYLSPAAVVFLIVYFSVGNGMNRVHFFVLCCVGILFFAVGSVFFIVTVSRYFLADYILYLNPIMRPADAVEASVRLTDGKLMFIAVQRLLLLPWLLAELLLLPLPFAAVYRRFCSAVLKENVFNGNKAF